jgi:hypothetical protein
MVKLLEKRLEREEIEDYRILKMPPPKPFAYIVFLKISYLGGIVSSYYREMDDLNFYLSSVELYPQTGQDNRGRIALMFERRPVKWSVL